MVRVVQGPCIVQIDGSPRCASDKWPVRSFLVSTLRKSRFCYDHIAAIPWELDRSQAVFRLLFIWSSRQSCHMAQWHTVGVIFMLNSARNIRRYTGSRLLYAPVSDIQGRGTFEVDVQVQSKGLRIARTVGLSQFADECTPSFTFESCTMFISYAQSNR